MVWLAFVTNNYFLAEKGNIRACEKSLKPLLHTPDLVLISRRQF